MKKISYKNISEELIMHITEEYIAYKNNNKVTKDKRNIVNLLI
jgi:hypothetical protein